MRLIDLDKAVSIRDEDNNAVIFTNVKNAEVKAIPVEWIKDYILKTWLTDYDSPELKAIERMLNDWREETENEISVMPVSDNSTIPLDYLGERKMNKLVGNFDEFLRIYYPDKLPLIILGHTEVVTKEMLFKYAEWYVEKHLNDDEKELKLEAKRVLERIVND